MFKHIVLFKTKKQEDAQFVFDRLRSMEGKIKELKYLEVGIDELHTERSFDVTLITGFDSKEDMDIYQVSTVNEWWGLTTMYNGSTEVDPFSSNWAWGKIQLDADFSDLSENKRLAVIAHEMGHVMGVAHSDFSNVLMRADIAYNSSSTSRAQTNDLGGINYLYK